MAEAQPSNSWGSVQTRGDSEFNRQTGIEILACESIDNFKDLDGHVALIDACDFIVTISNTSAHIAGAIGKDTYLLYPKGKGALWYWANQINNKMS